MAHPLRLLGRMAGGGRRGRLPPPLAALAHLSASPHRSTDQQLPSPAPPPPPPPRFLPFAVPARSFSWYSRSPSVPAADAVAAEAPVGEDASIERESIYLHDASTIDYGEVLPGAAGDAADAAVGVAVGSDGCGLSGFCMGTVVDAIDGFHSLTGLPWWITISLSTVAMRLVILPALYYKIYLDILSIPLFLIAYVVPQGSLIYWTTNGLFSVAQQLSLRNDVIRKMLGLPDIGAHSGNASPKSVLEGQKAMQWPLGGTPMQSKLGSSDNETPKFMFENSTIMEENVSESSSPEELLQQALQYLQTGCQDQAIPLIKTAIEKNPDLSECLIGMGQMLFQNKLFAESAVCYDHAIPMIKEQDPLLILAYFGAGLSRQQQVE
ncbi:hypothetical protein ACQ4PT_035126 [Festuca glaucescens]